MNHDQMRITLIYGGRDHALPGEKIDEELRVDAKAFAAVTGWDVKDVGLCRGPICVPIREMTEIVDGEGRVRLRPFAEALGAPYTDNLHFTAAALGERAEDRRAEQDGMIAPDFALPDLNGASHRLSDHRGKKVLLVAWSSWCGCREDQPVWQSLFEEMKDDGLVVITVAQDSKPEDAAPFIEKAAPTHPALIDINHEVSEKYGLINVPSVIWIDEEGVICRPPMVEHGSNMFQFAHGLDCEPHLKALRHWVKTGETDLDKSEARNLQPPPTAEEQQARAEFALGNHLLQHGEKEAANAHFEAAIALSPFDWTIRRGTMWQRGENPFGEDFGVVWKEWEDSGKPDYQSLAKERRSGQ